MTVNKNSILGVLDLSKHTKLGELLIFIENIKIKKNTSTFKNIDVAILSDDKTKLFTVQLPILYNYLKINTCFLFESKNIFKEFINKHKTEYYNIYPSTINYVEQENPLDSTFESRNFFKKKNKIPYLSSLSKKFSSTNMSLTKQLKNNYSVVVHLKNSTSKHKESDAIQNEWFAFFDYFKSENILFFLIGADDIIDKIKKLSNIIITRDIGLNIVDDLILIEHADLFMGMCSGPFQIALFNKKPYIVFKNPDHHKEEMKKEIGDKNKYIFAANNQNIYREVESFNSLKNKFSAVYKKVHR